MKKAEKRFCVACVGASPATVLSRRATFSRLPPVNERRWKELPCIVGSPCWQVPSSQSQ